MVVTKLKLESKIIFTLNLLHFCILSCSSTRAMRVGIYILLKPFLFRENIDFWVAWAWKNRLKTDKSTRNSK